MKCAKNAWITVVTLCVVLSADAALAANVTVGCPGGQPGQFGSISTALNSLDQFGPHTITVTGTCTESLFIADRDGITITAPFGKTATVNAASPADIVIQFFRARRMALNGLVIQGGSIGVIVNFGSDAVIQNCTIQGNSNDGLHPQQNASLVVENSTLQDNGGNGLTAESGANVTLSTYPSQRMNIKKNGYAGISVDGATLQVNFGTASIENNKGPAIVTNGGRLLIFGDSPAGPGNLLENNGEGIDISNGTSALFYGQTTVLNNGAVGLQVDGASLQLNGGALPNGTPDGILVEGHTTLGVNITGSAEVSFNGQHIIRGNGTAGADPLFLSGVRVSRATVTVRWGTQITSNSGPGILSDFNGRVQIGPDVIIAGNTGGGVRLLHMSVGNLNAPVHSSQPVACDSTSLLFGNLVGLAVHCGHPDEIASPAVSLGGIRP